MIDVETPGSPGWWLVRLDGRLRVLREGAPVEHSAGRGGRSWAGRSLAQSSWVHRPGLDLLADHLRGEPPLPSVSASWAEAVRPFVRLSRTNFAELVIASAADRMVAAGWASAAEDDRDGDAVIGRLALEVGLGDTLAEVVEQMLTMGSSHLAVGPLPGGGVRVTAQDPRACVTAQDPASGRVLAGLIRSVDEWSADELWHVHLPGDPARVWVARRSPGRPGDWDWDEALSGLVPGFELVPVENRGGVGDFERHLDLLDRINDQVFRRVIIAVYQAFRQRAARGLPSHDEAGAEIDYRSVFAADPGALWDLPDGVEMWESGVVDLTGIRTAIRDDVIALAAVTATPLHHVTPDAAAGSAEGASLMRERLVYRVEDRRRRLERPLARAISAALLLRGEEGRADPLAIRTLWEPAERHSLAERASAAVQATAAGLPWAAAMTDIMGYAPDELPRLESMRGGDMLYVASDVASGG